ncbi:protein-L-isoaspartate(D-aspartate) O-methyltransferase [Devosia lucknowensis]|uniref:Protein-L-isoaspartate O-methyltransferase n=1 Tax=Devosia lucknowensis TaxID=1096929 RepID=A0A1Y6ET26_9HYPH|nr:protein-L-isoaspartate O-methyltransferase [Devosia lucknowensis]SMQ63672.1 protein-L-isoaspartate(D-aspartate) O-methyltransferase [Devosia lucknowensis]
MNDFSHARKVMVDNQIATSSVTSPRLLTVLGRIPRENFVPAEKIPLAYSDAHIPLGNARFLPAPATFARLLQLAGIEAADRVLDYCPGTGYSTAVLSQLADEVVAVEPDHALAEATRRNLAAFAADNVAVTESLPPRDVKGFDVILLEGAVERVPEGLVDCLAPGGRLVCLLRHGPVGTAMVLRQTPRGVVEESSFNATLPVISGEPAAEKFVF